MANTAPLVHQVDPIELLLTPVIYSQSTTEQNMELLFDSTVTDGCFYWNMAPESAESQSWLLQNISYTFIQQI